VVWGFIPGARRLTYEAGSLGGEVLDRRREALSHDGEALRFVRQAPSFTGEVLSFNDEALRFMIAPNSAFSIELT
jgi:hypothetical protein